MSSGLERQRKELPCYGLSHLPLFRRGPGCFTAALAAENEFATPEEAKALLEKAVVAMK